MMFMGEKRLLGTSRVGKIKSHWLTNNRIDLSFNKEHKCDIYGRISLLNIFHKIHSLIVSDRLKKNLA